MPWHSSRHVRDVRAAMHAGVANYIGFLWNRWWGKRSWHSRRMRNPQFYVSGLRLMWSTQILNRQMRSCFWTHAGDDGIGTILVTIQPCYCITLVLNTTVVVTPTTLVLGIQHQTTTTLVCHRRTFVDFYWNDKKNCLINKWLIRYRANKGMLSFKLDRRRGQYKYIVRFDVGVQLGFPLSFSMWIIISFFSHILHNCSGLISVYS